MLNKTRELPRGLRLLVDARPGLLPLMTGRVGLPAFGMRLALKMDVSLLSPLRLRPPFSFSKGLTFATVCSTHSESRKKDKVIVISGPTGAGKSKLALELAKRVGGEIISADSVQVYRGLDVGSAKPSSSDRNDVAHHLLDVLHPSEEYSAGKFYEDARAATRDVLEKGRVPIVAGGTGLYLRWYIYGKPGVPKSSLEITAEVWEELRQLQRSNKWDDAVELVVNAGDPKARSVPLNDWYRLRRRLEIIKSSGSPPSSFPVPYDSFREEGDDNCSTNGPGERLPKDLEYDFMCFFLSSPRVNLYRSIDLRCEEMLMEIEGLLSEASWLLDIGLYPNINSATRAIGYRQAMEYLLGCRQEGGRSCSGGFLRFLSEFQKASRNFAKRQMTWFRNELIYQWLDASKPLEEVVEFIHSAYSDQSGEFTVPESLQLSKDVSGKRETYNLKSYRTQNKLFTQEEHCRHILDWIRTTQSNHVRAVQ